MSQPIDYLGRIMVIRDFIETWLQRVAPEGLVPISGYSYPSLPTICWTASMRWTKLAGS